MHLSMFRNVLRHCARMAIFLCLLAAFALAAQAQVVFSPPVNVSNSSSNTVSQQIALDADGNVNLVWAADATASAPADVFFSRSTDGGAAFSTPLAVSNHTGNGVFIPQIAVGPGGSIYIIWQDLKLGEVFTRSSDGGATFTAPQLVAWSQMAVDAQGNLNVAGSNNTNGVFFSRSTDRGASFSAPVQVSNKLLGGFSLGTDSGGNIYLAWSAESTSSPQGLTFDVFFSMSSDGGATFSPATNLSNYSTVMSITSVQVVADSMNNINVVWGPEDIVGTTSFSYRHSIDGGATFPTGYDGPFNYVRGTGPQMALDSFGNAHIVWLANTDGSTSGVRYDRMVGGVHAGGTVVANPFNLSYPQLAVDTGNNIDIVFGGGILTGGSPAPHDDIWLARSSDVGATFSALQDVSNTSGSFDLGNPVMTIGRDGSIYIAWLQTTSTGNFADIFFSRGTALSLASASLSITSVTGGSSSTGTVELSGPAPAGGAVISLSSSDASVSVPGTVTIAAGATSTTFTVSTSPVAAATTATISGVFGGVTQTTTITVEPPVLASLAMNPSSTMGGSSSTGTVALNGPAPAGGAVVALTNSNTSAASVPSSVTVPAGSSNATFTVNTSRVLCPNAATITGSFNAVTLTSNLAVMPFVNLPSQACSAIGAHGSTTVGKP